MTRELETRSRSTATPPGPRLGERLRQLRVSAGLTQTELAGERFSKEYVSQIERGKTKPTRETIEWLAVRRSSLQHPFLAFPLLAPPARLRGRARGRRARAPARGGRGRSAHDRRRLLPGVPRRRPRRPLGARTQLRREGAQRVRATLRP